MSELLIIQEVLWRQKSIEVQFTTGYCNSRIFHAVTITNRKKISIATLKSNNGDWRLETPGQIGDFLVEEFTKLFQYETMVQCKRLKDYIQTTITAYQNSKLSAILAKDELFKVVKSLYPINVRGLDGMSVLFFQHFWRVVGNDVTIAIQNIF